LHKAFFAGGLVYSTLYNTLLDTVKSRYVDKNPRATASLIFAIALGSAAQVGNIKTYLPVISNRLTPVTSHLEGAGNYLAACAAITLVHYTPPPFVGIILPCIYPSVKLLMNIRSGLLSFV
jgi:hypothetical protein